MVKTDMTTKTQRTPNMQQRLLEGTKVAVVSQGGEGYISVTDMVFNSIEFDGIKNEAGLNRFAISVKQWIAKTAAIGVVAKAGRYGGTYAVSP